MAHPDVRNLKVKREKLHKKLHTQKPALASSDMSAMTEGIHPTAEIRPWSMKQTVLVQERLQTTFSA